MIILKMFAIRNFFRLKKLQVELFFLKWWKRNIVDDFSFFPECFDCNLGSCKNCPILN